MTVEFRIKYNGETRRFGVPRDPFPSWTALSTLIKERFLLPADSDLVVLCYDESTKLSISSEGEMTFLQKAVFWWVDVANPPGCHTMELVVRQPKRPVSSTIALRVGMDDSKVRSLLHYPEAQPPTLAVFEEDARTALDVDHVATLYYDVGDGTWNPMASQKDWEAVGWPAAVQHFREGEQAGKGWASFFSYGVPPFLESALTTDPPSAHRGSSAYKTESLFSHL
ncbi:hypothetical protein JCM6882_004869 [Rhodosporidiobolus microsporus]